MTRSRIALAVATLALAPLAACGGDDGDDSPAARCEAAYERGEGNAATSERASWLADCIEELEAAGR